MVKEEERLGQREEKERLFFVRRDICLRSSNRFSTMQSHPGTLPLISVISVTLHMSRDVNWYTGVCKLCLDSAVYTPNDGDNWMMAKLNVQVTDIGYAQIVEHLGRV